MSFIQMHAASGLWALQGIFLLLFPVAQAAAQDRQVPEGIEVRSGYTLSVAESTLDKPRFMVFGDEGILYVSQPHIGEIKRCRDEDGDGYFESVTTFVSDYPTAHGMFWDGTWLWFTQSTAVLKTRDTSGDGQADEVETVIPEGRLPKGGGHWWRSILVHNDRIYTSIGDSGNITDQTDSKRQKIWSYALDGSDEQLFCTGIRNTEKLVVRPGSDEIWGMDHGSDWFGRHLEKEASGDAQPITDLNPPDEMNHYEQGKFYGHPFIVGSRLPRYEYMDRPDIVELAAETVSPAWEAGAHWAANGMIFYEADQFSDHHGDAFVAYHGSWNRSRKAGYCVTRVLFDQGRPYGELKYVDFLQDGKVLGRPVDVTVAPDGSLLISDDDGDRIYRLRHSESNG